MPLRLLTPVVLTTTLAMTAATLTSVGTASAQGGPDASADHRTPNDATEPHGDNRHTADDAPASGAGSLGWELAAATGAGALATVLSYGVGHSVYSGCRRSDDDDILGLRCASSGGGAMMLTLLAVAPLFTTAAVTVSGKATGGNGSTAITLGAAALGTLVGFGGAILIAAAHDGRDPHPAAEVALYTVLLAGPVVGALIGYRASSEPHTADTATTATITPTVHRDGMGVAMLGTF